MGDNCSSCKNYKDYTCSVLGVIVEQDFVCDFYKRKRSGAFRRKIAKDKRSANEKG